MGLRRQWLRDNGKVKNDNQYEVLFTKTTRFIMPLIGFVIEDFYDEYDRINFLINAYLDVDNGRIAIVIDNVDDPDLKELLLLNNKNPYFDGSTTDDEDKELVFFYKIPEFFKDDYQIFLSGKYSKMSDNYKNKMCSIYGKASNTKDHRPSMFDILFPTTFKREQLAKVLGVEIELIDEISEKLNMNYEQYHTTEQLKTISLIQKQEQEYESK